MTQALALAGLLGAVAPLTAQESHPTVPAAVVATTNRSALAEPADDDDEAELDLAEPDFGVVNLPTTKRLPRHKGSFRVTHRFAGNLRNGTFGEQAGNLFGLDQGAIIGFEYRFAVMRHLQAAAYRSNFDKTVQLYGKYDAIPQRGSMPLSISVVASIEGTNNFKEKYAPAAGVVLSRTVAGRFAAYVAPIWVNNTAASLDAVAHQHGAATDADADEHHDHRSTFYAGLGGRVRVLSTVYLVGEVSPRLRGYAPDVVEYGFGVEKRAGGHTFSLTFTNTFGTTFAQIARGGTANTLYLGFNLGRQFF
jgi:hypothetical protein